MSERSPITTHVLDTSTGRPAVGMKIGLSSKAEGADSWRSIGSADADADGRATTLMQIATDPGIYRLTFHTGEYYRSRGVETFYPVVSVEFAVTSATEHYHVPLLINPFGYSTYRGT